MKAGKFSTLIWPTGGLQWKPEWEAILPAVRGMHAPPAPDLAQLLAAAPVPSDEEYWQKESWQRRTAFNGRTWTWWTNEELLAHTRLDALRNADDETWLRLHVQLHCDWSGRAQLQAWVAAVCAAVRGPAFALEIALADELNLPDTCGRKPWNEAAFVPLREAVARADEDEYAAALAVAVRERTRSIHIARACAFVFAHRADWVAEALANPVADWEHPMRECVMAPAHYLAYATAKKLRAVEMLPAVLLQCRLHGEQALDCVALLLDRVLASDDAKKATLAASIAGSFHAPGIVDVLMARIDNKKARDAFDKIGGAYPVAALLVAIRRMLAGRSRTAETLAVRLALRHPEALPAALAEIDTAGCSRFESALAALNPVEAQDSALPMLLREPPWLREDRPDALPVLEVQVIATPQVIAWEPGQPEAALQADFSHDHTHNNRDAHGIPKALNLTDEGARRVLGGLLLRPQDFGESRGYSIADAIAVAPEAAQVALWNSYPMDRMHYANWSANNAFHLMLVRHGFAVFPGILEYLGTQGKSPTLALLLNTPELVESTVRLLPAGSRGRNAAQWIAKYPATVLYRVLPVAFGAQPTRERDDARRAVRWLAEHGERALVEEVAAKYGGGMPAATKALLDTDPLYLLPGVMPKLPGFFDPAICRRPMLTNGQGALPASALQHIAHMLMIGEPQAPYAGIALVQAACTPASLAEFAWDLYEAWAAAGGPAKENWAYRALAFLGDDETARRLLPRINEWSADRALRPRAEAGVALLAQIGTDVALMVLNVLATKARHKRVQRKAAEFIASAAEVRGLGSEELGDRLVPTLGLEEPDAQVLDFGPRRFTIAFDEALKPFVRDAQGARLKDLPKPLKPDDAALAAAATERYKALKKDVKTIASLQVTRLERAMLLRRRWSTPEFHRLFVEHPVVRFLAARLAWGVFEGERCVRALRISEDWSLADSADMPLALPLDDAATVGIPHVLELPSVERNAISQVFADYEVAQPFAQLARETFAFTQQECALGRLDRWEGKDVAVGSLLGLAQWTWQRGSAGDGGMIGSYLKPANDGLVVEFGFSPGIFVGSGVAPEYRQTLDRVWISRSSAGPQDAPARFAELDAVHASELIRDLESLAPAREEIP